MDESRRLYLSPEMEAVLENLCEARGLDKQEILANAERLMAYLDGRIVDLIVRPRET